jgi:Tfp pilus assembly protein PilE
MTNRNRNIIIAVAVVLVIVLSVFGVLVGAAVIGYRAAIRSGNEAAALQNLRTIAAFEVRYFNTHQRTFGTFDQLISESGLSSKFAGKQPIADGYEFTLSLAPGPEGSSSFKITADPLDPNTRTNHFYLDSDDQRIHVNAERQAGPSDPSN